MARRRYLKDNGRTTSVASHSASPWAKKGVKGSGWGVLVYIRDSCSPSWLPKWTALEGKGVLGIQNAFVRAKAQPQHKTTNTYEQWPRLGFGG